MSEPNLRHLVALFNMYDAIVSGKYKQNLECIRAHHNTMHSVWLSDTSSCYEREYYKSTDWLSSASTQYDKSLQFRLDNLHLNF
jgi:NAD+--asparagine ADP-ribosyltransferase